MSQCRELAKLVGRVSAFGNENKSLGSPGLEACAKGIQVASRVPLPGPKGLIPPKLPSLPKLPPSLLGDTGKSGGGEKGKDGIKGTADDDGPGPGVPSASQLPVEEPVDATPPAYSSEEMEAPLEPTPMASGPGAIRTPTLVLEGGLELTGPAFVPVAISAPSLVLEGEWIFRPLTIPTEALVLEGAP